MRYHQVVKEVVPKGTYFQSPTLQDLGPGRSVSGAFRPGFGYGVVAVSVTLPAGFGYKCGNLVSVTVEMVPVTPRTRVGAPFLHVTSSRRAARRPKP